CGDAVAARHHVEIGRAPTALVYEERVGVFDQARGIFRLHGVELRNDLRGQLRRRTALRLRRNLNVRLREAVHDDVRAERLPVLVADVAQVDVVDAGLGTWPH